MLEDRQPYPLRWRGTGELVTPREPPTLFEPHRGDEVAEWLKRRRDAYTQNTYQWEALDNALENYREHADTGTPLSEDVEGPHPED